MKIAMGADHAGYRYKEQIKKYLIEEGHEVHDFGTHSEDPVDYPIFIRPVAQAVAEGKYERGIVMGGSGNGEAITSNRIPGIHCCVCWDTRSASLARRHNNANMIAIGQRMVSIEMAIEIVHTWLDTPFEGGRHARRITMIDEMR